jgi:hypothetical protein
MRSGFNVMSLCHFFFCYTAHRLTSLVTSEFFTPFRSNLHASYEVCVKWLIKLG